MVLFQNSAPRGFGVGAGIWRMSYGSKKAHGVILTGCTISQIERKAEMSVQGQSRRFGGQSPTSGLPPEADIATAGRHVSKVPTIGIGGSLAAPPLPHHRTYGSVYGGSRGYANALRSNDSTRVGWAFGLIRRRERFDVFPSRLPGFTRRRR